MPRKRKEHATQTSTSYPGGRQRGGVFASCLRSLLLVEQRRANLEQDEGGRGIGEGGDRASRGGDASRLPRDAMGWVTRAEARVRANALTAATSTAPPAVAASAPVGILPSAAKGSSPMRMAVLRAAGAAAAGSGRCTATSACAAQQSKRRKKLRTPGMVRSASCVGAEVRGAQG